MDQVNNCMVSVFCSVYNHKKFIAQCLDSLVNQKTTFHYEIVVKDDASTDGTSDIIRAYHEKYPDKIIPLILETNHLQHGLGHVAFQRAFSLMRGKYIAMCEGDDFWTDENKLQKQVELMESHPDYALCGHAAYYADENGNLIQGDSFRYRESSGELTTEEVISSWAMATCSLLYRKSCRTDVIFPFQGSCINSDYALMVYMALKGKVYYLDELMSAYRVACSGSVTQKQRQNKEYFKKSRLEYVAMLDRIDDYSEKRYTRVINLRKRKTLFELYLTLRDGKSLRQYSDVYRTVPMKTKVKYILCVYFHSLYDGAEKIYHKLKGASHG